MTDPETRLREAVKQVSIVRDGMHHRSVPALDAELAKAEISIRGVAEKLAEDGPDDVDPSLVADGSTVGDGTDQINEDAFRLPTLYYPRLRPGILRRHNQVYHEYPDDTPAMRIPADLDGVVA